MIKIRYDIIKNNLTKLNRNDYLVLKSNAYGFGLKEVLQIALALGFQKYAVIDIKDAIVIRWAAKNARILLLGVFAADNLYTYERYKVEISINDIKEIESLKWHSLDVQVAVNTGMNRFGIRPNEMDKCLKLLAATTVKLRGAYTHSFNGSNEILNKQLTLFQYAIKDLPQLDFHFAASNLLGNKYADNFARRIGDAIYYNALNVYGRIVKVNYVYQSEYIGYDCGYQMPYDGYVGVIDIGYADGLARKCDGFTVYINNKYYYLIGKACMNHSFVLLNNDYNVLNCLVHFISPYNNIINYQNFFGKTSHEIYLDFLRK